MAILVSDYHGEGVTRLHREWRVKTSQELQLELVVPVEPVGREGVADGHLVSAIALGHEGASERVHEVLEGSAAGLHDRAVADLDLLWYRQVHDGVTWHTVGEFVDHNEVSHRVHLITASDDLRAEEKLGAWREEFEGEVLKGIDEVVHTLQCLIRLNLDTLDHKLRRRENPVAEFYNNRTTTRIAFVLDPRAIETQNITAHRLTGAPNPYNCRQQAGELHLIWHCQLEVGGAFHGVRQSEVKMQIDGGLDDGRAGRVEGDTSNGTGSRVVEDTGVDDSDAFGIGVLDLNQETLGPPHNLGALDLRDLDLRLEVGHRVARALADDLDDVC